jgi:hypothetical protein
MLGARLSPARSNAPQCVAIRVTVLHGQLAGFDTHVSVRCPEGESRDWRWWPYDGAPVPFHQDGSRVYVRELSQFPDQDPPVTLVSVVRGQLADSGSVARGRIRSRARWHTVAGPIACQGRASFSARERD